MEKFKNTLTTIGVFSAMLGITAGVMILNVMHYVNF